MSTCLANLERVGFPAGMAFTAHGVRIGVRATDPSVMDEIESLLPTGWKRRLDPRVDHLASLVVGDRERKGPIRKLHVVYSGAIRAFRSTQLPEALNFLEHHLEEYVAQMAPDRIFVHAGVVAWKGRAIVIPGSSHSGKTSLVTALLAAGATYYSDEFAVIDERGRVHPYLRPLRIRDQDDLGRRVTADEMGARSGRGSLPVGLVASTRYEAGARWRPRALSHGEATLELLSHTVPARFRPRQVMRVLDAAARPARGLKGRRGEAAEVAGSLLEAME
jgi:hypothetical protein